MTHLHWGSSDPARFASRSFPQHPLQIKWMRNEKIRTGLGKLASHFKIQGLQWRIAGSKETDSLLRLRLPLVFACIRLKVFILASLGDELFHSSVQTQTRQQHVGWRFWRRLASQSKLSRPTFSICLNRGITELIIFACVCSICIYGATASAFLGSPAAQPCSVVSNWMTKVN